MRTTAILRTATWPGWPTTTSSSSGILYSLQIHKEGGCSDVTQHLGASKGLGVNCPDSQCWLSFLVFNGPVSTLTSPCYLQGCVEMLQITLQRDIFKCVWS